MNYPCKKYLIVGLMTICAAFSVPEPATAAPVNMKLTYDGKVHDYSAEEINIEVYGNMLSNYNVPPIIIDGRTLVPIRAITEAMGAEIMFNGETKEVYITRENDIVVMKIDSTEGIKNGVSFPIEVPPKLINDSTMIPARAIAEAFDCQVDWNDTLRLVTIGDKKTVEKPPADNSQTVIPPTPTNPDTSVGPTPTTGLAVTKLINHGDLGGIESFTISATGQIGKIEKTVVGTDRIAVDIYGAEMCLPNKEVTVGSALIKSIRSAQFQTEPEMITRVVFDLNTDKISYDIALGQDKTSVSVSFMAGENGDFSSFVPPAVPSDNTQVVAPKKTLEGKGFRYDPAAKTLYLDKTNGLSASDIKQTDNYRVSSYVLTLSGGYASNFDKGTFYIGDNYIDNIMIASDNSGNLNITIQANKVMAYTMTEDDNHISLLLRNPKELYNKIVVIDAGHGDHDPGTTGNGYLEKDINLPIAVKIFEYLEQNSDIKVYITRISDTYPTNPYRAQMANDVADMFVSIHQNSASPNEKPNGIETLYVNHSNEKAGYLTSKIMAEFFLEKLVGPLGATSRGTKERNDLIILNRTTVPAIIIEDGFLSNPDEAAKLATDAYQDQIAKIVADGIIELFDKYPYR